jgi:hypothetical protein
MRRRCAISAATRSGRCPAGQQATPTSSPAREAPITSHNTCAVLVAKAVAMRERHGPSGWSSVVTKSRARKAPRPLMITTSAMFGGRESRPAVSASTDCASLQNPNDAASTTLPEGLWAA